MGDFPKISLTVDGRKAFYKLHQAVPLWDSGWSKVESDNELLLENFSVRQMTQEENEVFQVRVDEYSGSK